MDFKVGDRVSFLNTTGGGVVTEIVNEKIVKVTIEDGFEIPTMVNEIVKLPGKLTDIPLKDKYEERYGYSTQEAEEDFVKLHVVPNKSDQRPEGVYVAFVPQTQETPLVGMMDVYVVNHTPWQMMFAIYTNKSGSINGEEYGFVDAYSALPLKAIGRSEVENWCNGMIQALWFMEGRCNPLRPVSAILDIKPIKFYNEGSFVHEGILRKKAIMLAGGLVKDLGTDVFSGIKISKEDARMISEKMNSGQVEKKVVAPSFLDKHKIDEKIAEVDLHIGELVESYAGLSNADMLKIQLDYFHKCLDAAFTEKLSKVIFIHGVGNGVLKSEIQKRLRNSKGMEFYDASYGRYGFGATEVFLYRNK